MGAAGTWRERWTPADGQLADARWLAGGPLDRQHLRFRQLELNAQVVRFPSGQEPQFGGQAVYLMRIFGLDGDRVDRAAAGEHARRRAAFGGCCAQGRACGLRSRQCAGDRPGRLHDPRPAAGAQGDLLFDIRQCAAGQPSVHAAVVAAGSSPASISRTTGWCARRKRCWSGSTTAPARAATSRVRPPASTSSASTTNSPRRSTASRWGYRRISMPSCRAVMPMSRRWRQGASRTGSGRCRSHHLPTGRMTAASPMERPTSRSLA